MRLTYILYKHTPEVSFSLPIYQNLLSQTSPFRRPVCRSHMLLCPVVAYFCPIDERWVIALFYTIQICCPPLLKNHDDLILFSTRLQHILDKIILLFPIAIHFTRSSVLDGTRAIFSVKKTWWKWIIKLFYLFSEQDIIFSLCLSLGLKYIRYYWDNHVI